jgi:hypothetical protein
MIEFDCEICGKRVRKPWSLSSPGTPRYCSRDCKAEAQRRQKPVDREWLYEKYIVEGLGAPEIAHLVGRDEKRVWEWLKGYKIPTRPRGGASSPGSFKKGQSSAFAGHRHTEQARDAVRQARFRDGRVPYLKDGKHHLKGKRGAETPNWKGGITPEHARVYDSQEWKEAVKSVWKRDNATCQRCGKHHNTVQSRGTFDIHHIIGFEVIELRCVVSNLVLLCEPCHYWVHSNENTRKDFLQ